MPSLNVASWPNLSIAAFLSLLTFGPFFLLLAKAQKVNVTVIHIKGNLGEKEEAKETVKKLHIYGILVKLGNNYGNSHINCSDQLIQELTSSFRFPN